MTRKKRQVCIIHGGTVFRTRDDFLSYLASRPVTLDRFRYTSDWKANLQNELGDGYDLLYLSMPNKQNASYAEWALWFSRIIPLLDNDCIYVGHSLGGVFLVRYFTETAPHLRPYALFLVAAPFNDEGMDEHLGGFAPQQHSVLVETCKRIFIYHSTDDPVVPYDHFQRYAAAFPCATLRTFSTRGHFLDEEFPEIVNDIRSV